MNLFDTDEYYGVREAAFDSLRLGTALKRHRWLPLCQYLILPSFDNPVSWDVLRVKFRDAGWQTRLYRSVWRMDLDEKVIHTAEERPKHPRPYPPTIEFSSVPIDRSRVEETLSRLCFIRIPLCNEELFAERLTVILDGVSYEFSVGECHPEARISWHVKLPEEWQALQPIITELEEVFEEAWTNGTERSVEGGDKGR